MTTTLFLSLGGNMGDRRALMDAAVAAIGALPETRVTARSTTVRSAPDGPVAQAWFANLALVVETGLSPSDFGAAARSIEANLGRDRTTEISWGPRPIDIDVVAVETAPGEAAPLPGRALDDRAFIVVPLAEIAPAILINGRPLAEIAAAADSASLVRLDWSTSLR